MNLLYLSVLERIFGWHEIIGEHTIADAILDRLAHTAHRLYIKGESMRKNLKKTVNLTTKESTLCT